MRFIYVDEAGTSVHEPVAVVVGAIIHADKQWRALEDHLTDIMRRFVPPEDRASVIFHATELFSGSKYFDRERWPFHVRLTILREILSAWRIIGIPMSVGYRFKKDGLYDNEEHYALLRHGVAYVECILGCEAYMRSYADEGEIALVVAEDVTHVRGKIRQAHHVIKDPPPGFPYRREMIPIRRIIDTVHFADKSQSALLQFSDAVAFTFRRYLGGYPHADDLMSALLMGPAQAAQAGAFSIQGHKIYVPTGPGVDVINWASSSAG